MSPASVDGLKSSGAVGGPKPPGEALIPLETLATSRAVPVQVEPEWSETPGPRDSRAVGHPERGVWDEHSSLRLYLRDAVETPLLTAQEEVELARRIQKGDEAAREHMIRANLRLVIKIAREYEDYGLPLLDLVNEGNIGLMRAVERFDPDRGAKLSTYAAWWIKQSIKRALSNQSKSIRRPRSASRPTSGGRPPMLNWPVSWRPTWTTSAAGARPPPSGPPRWMPPSATIPSRTASPTSSPTSRR